MVCADLLVESIVLTKSFERFGREAIPAVAVLHQIEIEKHECELFTVDGGQVQVEPPED